MWLGKEPTNWGTNSQPARTAETLKARMPVTSPTRADYPIKGLQQHSLQGCPGFRQFQVSQVSVSKFQIRGGT
ncbi:unnamed protein product [Prunus armeniaca]